MMTAFNLTDWRFEDNAVSRVLSTASWPLRRVMISNLNGSSVSRLVPKLGFGLRAGCAGDFYLRLR